MIIGSILETSNSGGGTQNNNLNGASSVIFYNMNDATEWARIQSEGMVYGTANYQCVTLISVVNTDTGERRWWFGGTEYTG